MKKIVFATHNPHKVEEIQQLMSGYKVLSLSDLHCKEDISETGSSFAENALIKAKYVFEKYRIPCFGDDSGLMIPALNGEPGIYSARYAGTGKSEDNITLVLQKMEEHTNKSAFFKTVIALVGFTNNVHYFEGEIYGKITAQMTGENGFGYDPIFVPDGYTQTFAQMPSELKNKISHRGLAVSKLIEYLSASNI